MYQVCTCPQSNLTGGDPHCPIHGQPPASKTYSYCEPCARYAAKMKDREGLANIVSSIRFSEIDWDLKTADAVIRWMEEG